MKIAAIPDWWRAINEFKKYNAKLKKITFKDISQFDDFELEISSAVSFLTGRNGIGKTSFLKLVCGVLNKDNEYPIGHFSDQDRKGVKISLNIRGNDVEMHNESETELPINAEYFDASNFSTYVLDSISINPDKSWSSDSEARQLSPDDIEIIKKVTGKRYDSILVEEVTPEEDKNGFAKQIPLFTVVIGDISYQNENMGSGEHKALVLIWKLLTAEDHSVLLIEEPESFICPNYQSKLINYLAWYASSKKLTVIVSTHSEHVMKAQQSTSNFIFQKSGKNRFKLVSEGQENRYLAALGLKPNRDKLLLVEDSFAKLMLECILAKLDQDLFDTSTIHILAGESDIKAVTSHLSKGEHVQVLGIYDADMVGQKLGIRSKLDYLFLPDLENRAPEETVIKAVELMSQEMAIFFGISHDEYTGILDDHIEDYHDWFIELQRKLPHVSLFELKRKCINEWTDQNIEICKKFIFELKHIGKVFNSKLGVINNSKIAVTMCGLQYNIENLLIDMPPEGTTIRSTIKFNAINEKKFQLDYN